MNILAVSGSPRKGNTEWMLSRLLEFLAQSGAEVELILLRKKEIKRCTGCLTCEDRKVFCKLKDDMQEIYPKLLETDVIILGSPVYITSLNTPTVRSRDGVLPASFGVKYNMGYGIGKSGALCLPMRLSYCTGDKISTEGIQ